VFDWAGRPRPARAGPLGGMLCCVWFVGCRRDVDADDNVSGHLLVAGRKVALRKVGEAFGARDVGSSHHSSGDHPFDMDR
jgi:hypothetical protein